MSGVVVGSCGLGVVSVVMVAIKESMEKNYKLKPVDTYIDIKMLSDQQIEGRKPNLVMVTPALKAQQQKGQLKYRGEL